MFYAIPCGDFLYMAMLPALHKCLLICTTSMYLLAYGGEIWRGYLAVIFITLGSIFKLLGVMFSTESNTILSKCGHACFWTGTAWFLVSLFLWFRHLWSISRHGKISSKQYVCSLYTLPILFNMLGRMVASRIKSDPISIIELGTHEIMMDSIMTTVGLLLLFLLQKHILQRDLVISEVG
jgi:hypothetical protein